MQEENMSRFAQFESWLTNKFWFHYKWYFLLGVFVLTFLILTVFQAVNTVTYDRTVVYAHTGPVVPEKTELVRAYVQGVANAYTDGKEKLVDVFEVTDSNSETGKRGQKSIYAAFTSPDYVLMLVDRSYFELYSALGYFEQIPGSESGVKGVYIESLDLYAVANKGPTKQYTMAEAIAKNVKLTEEELADMNAELQKEHDDYVELTLDMVKSMEIPKET
ncbi:MAG: hypothetical protein GX111_10310 [Clostridiales bacterium]|nr:hypothetical protein [Clostridiales bacterium]